MMFPYCTREPYKDDEYDLNLFKSNSMADLKKSHIPYTWYIAKSVEYKTEHLIMQVREAQ